VGGVGNGEGLRLPARPNCWCKSQMWKIYFIFLAFKLNKVFASTVLFALACCHLHKQGLLGISAHVSHPALLFRPFITLAGGVLVV